MVFGNIITLIIVVVVAVVVWRFVSGAFKILLYILLVLLALYLIFGIRLSDITGALTGLF